jgi:hypothetical protein
MNFVNLVHGGLFSELCEPSDVCLPYDKKYDPHTLWDEETRSIHERVEESAVCS